jgi:hypothetical protein
LFVRNHHGHEKTSVDVIPTITIDGEKPYHHFLRTISLPVHPLRYYAYSFRYCPQSYGINTAGAFAFAFNIIYPVYFAGSGDSTEK